MPPLQWQREGKVRVSRSTSVQLTRSVQFVLLLKDTDGY